MEDEQDQGEQDKQQVPWEFQQVDESQGAEGGLWSDGEPGQTGEEESEGQRRPEEVEESEEAEQDLEEPEDQEKEEAPWESFGPDEGPSLRPEGAECVHSAEEKDFITESDDGGRQQNKMQKGGQVGLLYTPDTDASKTSDADVPPSYSKAVSFDRLELSDDESDMEGKRRMLMTSDSRSDSRSDIMLPSMTTELTASELLLNK